MTTTSAADPLVGQLFDYRYRIHHPLARGGMACVYRATDTRLDRLVALKVMHADLAADTDAARKFESEARAATQLSHPHVVSIFDQGSDGERPYIVMELVCGHTLRSVISARAPLRPSEALDLIDPVLGALGSAHRAGLVHRDVKPENVLISDQGEVKVADFGLARAITAQTAAGTAGLLMGTLSYLSPELVTGGRADARSDVYSAGIVLFELLTGQKPHTGDTPIQVAYAHVHHDVPPPSGVPGAHSIPDYLDALVTRATARNPDDRPHDARVLLTQLRQVGSALHAGVSTDPELTQDLTVPLRSLSTGSGPSGADTDATQVVDPPTVAISRADRHRAAPPPGAGDPAPTQINTLSMPARPAPAGGFPDPPPPATPVHASGRSATLHRHSQSRVHDRHRVRGLVLMLVVLVLAGVATAVGWYIGASQLG